MADGSELMTREEYVAAQRMLKVLDDQLGIMKEQIARREKPWTMSPTDRQAFFYSSDDKGLMRFQSDSSFVAEQIFVYTMPIGGKAFLSIEDMSSGRGLTVAQEPPFNDLTNTTTKIDGIWIPPSAWTPVNLTGPERGDTSTYVPKFLNFDHVVTLETDFVVARSGVMRFRFRHSADGEFRPFDPSKPNPLGGTVLVPPLNYAVVLVGYKVY